MEVTPNKGNAISSRPNVYHWSHGTYVWQAMYGGKRLLLNEMLKSKGDQKIKEVATLDSLISSFKVAIPNHINNWLFDVDEISGR